MIIFFSPLPIYNYPHCKGKGSLLLIVNLNFPSGSTNKVYYNNSPISKKTTLSDKATFFFSLPSCLHPLTVFSPSSLANILRRHSKAVLNHFRKALSQHHNIRSNWKSVLTEKIFFFFFLFFSGFSHQGRMNNCLFWVPLNFLLP